MADSKVELRNPLVAAVLAYLIPGLGHLYQRRYFKAGIYSACILGTFFYGMQLGDWRIVPSRLSGKKPQGGIAVMLRHFGHAAIGLPALPATIQSKRYHQQNTDAFDPDIVVIRESLSSELVGVLQRTDENGDVVVSRIEGQVKFDPVSDDGFGQIVGSFDGASEDGSPVRLELTGLELGPEMNSNPRRTLRCRVVENQESVGYIKAEIPRSFFNWFQMPLEEQDLELLHGKLGKHFEIAEIFMWIAGLLNLLAIWDAFEGPAYGYGDEPEEANDEKSAKDENVAADENPEEVAVAASTAG